MKPDTKVGFFFTGAIFLLAVLVFRSEKLEIGGKKNQSERFTYFDSVAGLNVQSAVRIAGVKVGDVRTIALENGKARVVVGLSQDVPIYADAFVSLGSIGILGEKFIDLDAGHSAKGLFPEGKPLPSKAGVSLDNLMESLSDISKNVKGVTQALNESIGGEQGRQ